MSSKLGARTKTPTLQLPLGDQDVDRTGRPPRPKPSIKAKDECPSPDSQTTTRIRSSQETARGVLTSETSAYYLVKSQGKWVPISKGNLLYEDGTRVPRDADFSELRGRKVVLTGGNGNAVKALLSDDAFASGDEAMSVQSTEPEEPRSVEALERMARMTSKLFADLTAISQYCKRPGADPRRIEDFLKQRKHAYRKRSVEVLEDLRSHRSSSLQRSRRELTQFIGNFPSSEEKNLLCDYCRSVRFAVVFSCGHRACRRCADTRQRCVNCKSDFSNVDLKLLHFDKFKAKRSNSYSQIRL